MSLRGVIDPKQLPALVESGEFEPCDPGELADHAMALFDGLGLRALLGDPAMPLEQAPARIAEVLGPRLGVEPAMIYPRATEHVPEMLEMIEGLLEKGYAYQVGEDVYYDVTRFERYGRLSGNKLGDLDAGARVDVREEKRHHADFALWKARKPEDGDNFWDSPWGEGRPGWHLECSAMARKTSSMSQSPEKRSSWPGMSCWAALAMMTCS